MAELTVDELDKIFQKEITNYGSGFSPSAKKALLNWHNKEQVKLLEDINTDISGKTFSNETDWRKEYERISIKNKNRLTKLKGE